MLFRIALLLYLNFIVMFVYADETQTRIGYAYDKETKKLVYSESHHEEYADNLILKSHVIYKDASGKIIAKKTINFNNNPYMPEFSLKNSETGHKEITRFIQSKYEVVFTKMHTETEKTARLNIPEDGISDAGFDNFIIKHWNELIAGKTFRREFLIPSMMDFIKFRIYQSSVIDETDQPLRVINIEPDSFLIRAFAGTTKLFYDRETPKLKRFDGLSNMRDGNGDNFTVKIRYEELKKLAAY